MKLFFKSSCSNDGFILAEDSNKQINWLLFSEEVYYEYIYGNYYFDELEERDIASVINLINFELPYYLE